MKMFEFFMKQLKEWKTQGEERHGEASKQKRKSTESHEKSLRNFLRFVSFLRLSSCVSWGLIWIMTLLTLNYAKQKFHWDKTFGIWALATMRGEISIENSITMQIFCGRNRGVDKDLFAFEFKFKLILGFYGRILTFWSWNFINSEDSAKFGENVKNIMRIQKNPFWTPCDMFLPTVNRHFKGRICWNFFLLNSHNWKLFISIH